MALSVRTFPAPAVATDIGFITMPSSAGTALSCVTNNTTTMTSSTLFQSIFPGLMVTGTGMETPTYVSAVASRSSLTLSVAANDGTTNNRTFSHNRPYARLVSVKFRLVTDGTAASRVVKLTIDDGTNTIWVAGGDPAQTASTTCDWCFAPGSPLDAAAAGGAQVRSYNVPDGLEMGPGWRIGVTATNKQVGDQFSAIVAVFEELKYTS